MLAHGMRARTHEAQQSFYRNSRHTSDFVSTIKIVARLDQTPPAKQGAKPPLKRQSELRALSASNKRFRSSCHSLPAALSIQNFLLSFITDAVAPLRYLCKVLTSGGKPHGPNFHTRRIKGYWRDNRISCPSQARVCKPGNRQGSSSRSGDDYSILANMKPTPSFWPSWRNFSPYLSKMSDTTPGNAVGRVARRRPSR